MNSNVRKRLGTEVDKSVIKPKKSKNELSTSKSNDNLQQIVEISDDEDSNLEGFNVIDITDDEDSEDITVIEDNKNVSGPAKNNIYTSDSDSDSSSDDEIIPPKPDRVAPNNGTLTKQTDNTITEIDSTESSESEDEITVSNAKVTTTSNERPQTSNDQPKLNKRSSNQIGPQWHEHEIVAEQLGLDLNITKNIVNLLQNGNTIPFIARYRRHMTNNMSPELLRELKETYEEVSALKTKISSVVRQLDKNNILNDDLLTSVTASRSLEELEYIYAPYKPGNKRSLAERAKELGLEQPALNLLYNRGNVNLGKFGKKEIQGIIHIISSIIATDTEMLAFIRKLRTETNFVIKTKKAPVKSDTKQKPAVAPDKTGEKPKKAPDESKFENYFNFEITTKFIKPHQVMAINRGEALKFLSVKTIIPDHIHHKFKEFCQMKWLSSDSQHPKIVQDAIEDAYTRSVQPHIIREIRSELKSKAERASYEVFSTNLKHLLLMPPIKGKPILGIDPGYTNGCKLALVSPTGMVLDTDVIYPHRTYNSNAEAVVKRMLHDNSCELIALGNGTACRPTEEWLTKLIKSRVFDPLDVKYTIVNEDGASIYSCSPEARKEFQTLDPNLISAVSLARRVQDPLAELVKVEPKHLGVGMYQHDLKKKQLEEALAEVVSECVSFVGVDLNTTSKCLLKYVAGMSEKRAQQIIQHREANGAFTHRKQIMDVFGIGQKLFEQCAGFLRVGPLQNTETFYKNPNHTKFDCTDIHPESYKYARKFLKVFGLKENDVGEPEFIKTIEKKSKGLDVHRLSMELGTTPETIELIREALTKPLNYDLRVTDKSQEQFFRKGLTRIEDLQVGIVLTGRVQNVTNFGCFVDIGVGKSGMIHTSKFNGLTMNIGTKVEVKVISLEISRGRIGLQAIRIL